MLEWNLPRFCSYLYSIYPPTIGWIASWVFHHFRYFFIGVANISSTPEGWEGGGWVGGYEVVGKGYVFAKTIQMVSIGAIFTSTYCTKQLNPWPNSSASHVVNYSRLSACQGDMDPFEGNPSTRGHLTSLRNKPQQKQPRERSASILAWSFSQCIQLSFDGEKCFSLLCAWKVSFLQSSHTHIYICILYGSKFLWDNIFVNFGIALCIMIILALKFSVLYRCSPANISRQCQRTPHRHLLENLPQCIASAWSIINTHNSVSIPFDPVYLRVYNHVVGFSDRN